MFAYRYNKLYKNINGYEYHYIQALSRKQPTINETNTLSRTIWFGFMSYQPL